jgi:hypothetical protein
MFKVKVVGLKKLQSDTKKCMNALETGSYLDDFMQRLVKMIKYNAPRKTGALIASVSYEKLSKDTYRINVSATNERGEPYPYFLEFGTKYIRVGTPENPRVYQSSSGKMAQLPYVRSAIYRLTTKHQLKLIVRAITASFYRDEGRV